MYIKKSDYLCSYMSLENIMEKYPTNNFVNLADTSILLLLLALLIKYSHLP